MAFVWVAIVLLCKTFELACCEVQIGTTTPDNRMDGSIIIAVRTDLERCGRVCLYQDQCVAINHNSNTSICELLKSEKTLEESPGFSYSSIKTWTMTNDPCYPNLCSNMTSCRKACHGPGSGGYYCTTFEMPCDKSECQNNATCINELTSYTCKCPEGYSGDHCQKTPCDQSNCQNNATCINDLNTYTCLCPEGYGAEFCQYKLCPGNKCSNGGISVDEPQPSLDLTFTCLCPDGYNGTYCTVCGDFVGKNGTITTTNYPDLYPKDEFCIWFITTEEGSSILLKFKSLSMMATQNGNCAVEDFVMVYEFEEDGQSIIGLKQLCGNTIPDEILSTGNRMIITFISQLENNFHSNGFEATFESVYAP